MRASTKKIMKSLMPPLAYSGLQKLSSKLGKKAARTSFTETHTVQGGPLKGKRLSLDLAGSWQKEMIRGSYDSFFFKYLETLDLKGKAVFDIGGHIGYHSLAFGQYAGKDGKVFVFEPNEANYDRLLQNLALNADSIQNVTAKKYAVSDAEGREEFVFSARIENGSSSGSFLDRSHTIWEKSVYEASGGFARTDVETVTIDGFIRETDCHPALVKIDVEGAEYLVLQGAQEMLAHDKPIILIEVHSIFNMFKTARILERAGYSLELLDENKDGRCFFAALPK